MTTALKTSIEHTRDDELTAQIRVFGKGNGHSNVVPDIGHFQERWGCVNLSTIASAKDSI